MSKGSPNCFHKIVNMHYCFGIYLCPLSWSRVGKQNTAGSFGYQGLDEHKLVICTSSKVWLTIVWNSMGKCEGKDKFKVQRQKENSVKACKKTSKSVEHETISVVRSLADSCFSHVLIQNRHCLLTPFAIAFLRLNVHKLCYIYHHSYIIWFFSPRTRWGLHATQVNFCSPSYNSMSEGSLNTASSASSLDEATAKAVKDSVRKTFHSLSSDITQVIEFCLNQFASDFSNSTSSSIKHAAQKANKDSYTCKSKKISSSLTTNCKFSTKSKTLLMLWLKIHMIILRNVFRKVWF